MNVRAFATTLTYTRHTHSPFTKQTEYFHEHTTQALPRQHDALY